jgi:hypothetical protein
MSNNLEIQETKNKAISIQEIQTLYFNTESIKESGISLRRLDYKGNRNYFTITPENLLNKIYTSVTTFTKNVLPTSNFLLQWMKNKTPEEQEFILKSSSTYGTLMDILFNKLLIDKKLEDISSQVFKFTMERGLYSIDQDKWTNQLKRDCLSFAQFIKDYDVKPILVSCPLKSDSLGIAGTLDLLCEMNHKIPTLTDLKNKNFELKRINALIDYKAKIGDFSLQSDRNSFYDSECLQLWIYKYLVEENFDLQIDRFINLTPKNWRTNIDYNLKDWTETKTLDNMKVKFPKYHEIFKIDSGEDSRKINVIEDSISLENFESEIQTYSIEDFINKNLQEDKKNV